MVRVSPGLSRRWRLQFTPRREVSKGGTRAGPGRPSDKHSYLTMEKAELTPDFAFCAADMREGWAPHSQVVAKARTPACSQWASREPEAGLQWTAWGP